MGENLYWTKTKSVLLYTEKRNYPGKGPVNEILNENVLAVEQTGRRKRSMVLPVPTRIILNERGVSFFLVHQRFLHPFETADGAKYFGFRLERVNYAWLKKLFLRGYIEKVEIQVKDITNNNLAVRDAIKMVFFAMFRRRINLTVLDYIYDSPMLRAWNRANPKKIIGPGVKISEKSLRDLLHNMEEQVADMRNGLTGRIIAKLSPSTMVIWEDEKRLTNFIRELIEDIDPLIMFVLVGSKPDDRELLVRNISRWVSEFVRRVDILDLASLLGIELVSAAERSALVRLMENLPDIRTYLESPIRRKSLMDKKNFRGSTVVVAVPKDISSEKRRLRFRFSVYNDGADVESERKLMEDFTEHSYSFNSGQPLEDFFKHPRNALSVYEDNGLCFYYLTILREQCGKENILLDTHIKASASGRSVVTTLRFGF
jgi:hypothetical protein